jgi:N-acetylglucosamine-6-phosphate deacetylase
MPPAPDTKIHVRSSRVVVDGVASTALVELAQADGRWRVASIGPDSGAVEAVDVGDCLLVPAPFDLHFHGAGGIVVPPEGDARDIDRVLATHARAAGWSHPAAPASYEWVATLPIPQTPPADPVEHLADAARSIARHGSDTSCRGLRIEGLFLNPSRAGVWPAATFRRPDVALLDELHAAARDGGTPLLVIDVAPELDGALELITRACELGIVASLAHTDATWDQAMAGIDAGATLATHAWNAMRPTTHRDPGVVAAVLADPRVTCELICDGVHLHPGTIALSIAASGPGRWLAISDASPFAGCEPGAYEWAGTTVTHDGTTLRDPQGRLAGSASLLDTALQVLVAGGVDQIDAALAIGDTPRRVLDPHRGIGLQVGDPAWIVSLSGTPPGAAPAR